jgi:putative transposase
MQLDILRQAASDYSTKKKINTANKDKYSISAMCRWLNILRSNYITKP